MNEGIPDSKQLTRWFGGRRGGVIVLYDIMDDRSNGKRVLN